MFCNMFVLVTDYTLRNIMSANDQGIVAVTGRAEWAAKNFPAKFCFPPGPPRS